LRGYLTTIETVTGQAPPTCPWRAFYVPIVREVMAVAWAVEGGNLAAVLGPDPAYKLTQAVGCFKRALTATQNEEARCQREESAAKRRAESAMRKAQGHG
jgi:hypothetical protein